MLLHMEHVRWVLIFNWAPNKPLIRAFYDSREAAVAAGRHCAASQGVPWRNHAKHGWHVKAATVIVTAVYDKMSEARASLANNLED